MDISAAPNASEKEDYKTLLEKCRDLVADIAEQLESLGSGTASSLWDAFVLDTVRDMTSILTTAPQGLKGRSSTAYVSSMAACGGIRTLRTCLDGCLPPLIGALRDSGGDEEKAAAAALAAGTLFSSSGKSLTKASADGIAVHPHPLQQYSSDVVRALIALHKNAQEESLRIAAVNGLGATLLSVPSSILGTLTSSILTEEGDDVKLIQEELLSLSSQMISETDPAKADWALACSRVIGSALGRGLTGKSHGGLNTCVLDDNDVIVDAVTKTIFPDIIESVTKRKEASTSGKTERFDLVALANACEVGGRGASKTIISQLLSAIQSKLSGGDANNDDSTYCGQHPAVAPALALSYVVKKGGGLPASVFHELSSPQITPLDIIEALCISEEGEGQQRQVGMSKLLLPDEVEKERSVARERIDLANSILPHFIPAYKKAAVPISHLERFVSSVSKVLPPLSQKDNIRLSVTLPIIAAILGNPQMRSKVDEMGASLLKQLEDMASPIADYALCSEWDPKARSAASSCLFQILLYYQKDKTKCISSSVLKESISPSVTAACNQCESMTDESEEAKSFEAIKSTFDLLAVVGSAAACRGGASSPTSDVVTRMLVDIACKNEAIIPFTEETVSPREDSSDIRTAGQSLPAMAASSFGMMLSVQNGGPFWRQRMIHIALPLVLAASKASSTSTVSAVSGPPIGSLVAATHIVCCTPLMVIGEKRAQELINMIARGFVEFANARTLDDGNSSSSPKHFEGWNDLMAGLLASMLKLLSSNSDAMLPYIAGLIPNYLVVCSASSQPDDIPSQLLALQCLVAITHLPSAKRICKAHKITVTSGLGELMDHPSVILRRAAVHARNVWFMLE